MDPPTGAVRILPSLSSSTLTPLRSLQQDLELLVESLSVPLHHLNSVRAQDPPPTNPSISSELRSLHEAPKGFVSAFATKQAPFNMHKNPDPPIIIQLHSCLSIEMKRRDGVRDVASASVSCFLFPVPCSLFFVFFGSYCRAVIAGSPNPYPIRQPIERHQQQQYRTPPSHPTHLINHTASHILSQNIASDPSLSCFKAISSYPTLLLLWSSAAHQRSDRFTIGIQNLFSLTLDTDEGGVDFSSTLR